MSMDENQKYLATVISQCRYAPATSSKRFALSLPHYIEQGKPLSEKQLKYLYYLACVKRNQIGKKAFDLVPRDVWIEYKKTHKSVKEPNH